MRQKLKRGKGGKAVEVRYALFISVKESTGAHYDIIMSLNVESWISTSLGLTRRWVSDYVKVDYSSVFYHSAY